MNLAGLVVVSCLASCSAIGPATDGQPKVRESRISVYLGQRNMNDEDFYAPLDEQAVFGLEYSREPAGGSIGFEVGIMGSADEETISGVDTTASNGELYGGIHKTFGTEVVRPYVGAGLSFINSNIEFAGFGDDDDSSLAAYVHGGLGVHFSDTISLGFDLRFLFGSDIQFEGFVESDADYGQFALVLAFDF